jgi:hypothetical protein
MLGGRPPAIGKWILVGLVLAIVGVGLWQEGLPTASGRNYSQASRSASEAVLPGYTNLTVAQKLDRAMKLSGMHGVLRGIVGSSTTLQVQNQDIVTDYHFVVTDARPMAAPPALIGQAIALRVQGGCIGRLCSGSSSRGPQIATGEDIVLFVRDQGTLYGGNTSTRIVLSSAYDVFIVRNGIATGEADWSSYSEPITNFLHHFGN